MTSYVVDACVLIKWFIPEVHTESAVKLLENRHALLIPDLLYPELGSVLWEKVRKKEISQKIAQEIIQAVHKWPWKYFPVSLYYPPLVIGISL